MAEHPMDMDELSQPDQKKRDKTVEFYLEAFEMEIRSLLTESDVKKLILLYEKFDTDEKRRLSQYTEKKTPVEMFNEIIKSIRNLNKEQLKYISLAQAFKKTGHEKIHLILTGEALPTNDTHKQLIYKCGGDICQMMAVDQILPFLVMEDVVCEEDRQAIQSKLEMKGSWEAAFQLLLCLLNRKVNWYQTFMTILLKHQHQDLANLINRELKKMWEDGKNTTESMSFSQHSGVSSSSSSSSSWDVLDEQSSVVEHVITDHQDSEPMDDLDAPPPVPPRFDSFQNTENGTMHEMKGANLNELNFTPEQFKSGMVEENKDETNETQQDTSELDLKDYQLELAENAVAGKNTVICAGTGTGKTLVALHVVKEHLKTRAPQGKREVVYMARTSKRIKQQADRFKKFLPQFKTKLITGEHEESSNIGSLLELNDILCFTPQVLLNYLDSGLISSLTELSLIILDECHHTQKDEPYHDLMRMYFFEKLNGQEDLPQVIGLTASIGVGKSNSDEAALDYMLHLFASLDVRDLSTVQRCTDSYKQEICHTVEEVIAMTPTYDPCKDILLEAIRETEDKLKSKALFIPDMVEMMTLKCPDDKQSQEYNQWTVEVEKMEIHIDEDDETVRNIRTLAIYLNVYSAALESNTLLGPAEVMKHLAKKYKQEIQKDKKENITDVERELLFNLQNIQMKLANHGKAENANIKVLCENLKVIMHKNMQDTRAMVFVKARATCVALTAVLKKDFKELGIDLQYLYGKENRAGEKGMPEIEQKETVEKFRSGVYKILVSTSAGKEGIDVPDCNIVLNCQGNQITKIQMKGQKKGHNGMMERINVFKLAMMQRALKLFYKMDCKLIETKITSYQQKMSIKVLSLEEALQKEPNTIVNLAVKVLEEVGGFVTYTNKDNQEKQYYSIVIGDHSTFREVRSYNINIINKFKKGSSVLLSRILRKTGEHSFWIVSTSTANKCPTVKVPETLVSASKHTKHEEVTPLAQAVNSLSRSKVVAKIFQTSPLKYRKDRPIKFLTLRDHEDGPRVKIALFGDHATRECKEGAVLSVSDTYKWKQTKTLCTMESTKVEFLDSNLINIPTDGVQVYEDSDFEEDKKPEQFTIMSVATAHVYKCCPTKDCRNKKLEGDKCPTCENSCLTRDEWYCYATVKVKRGVDNECEYYRIFKDNLDKFFKVPNLKTSDPSGLKQSLSDQLPANGTAFFKDGVMKILSAKRLFSE